jgi:hypothetical protein
MLAALHANKSPSWSDLVVYTTFMNAHYRSNDHYQVFGNRRFNAIAYDHGYVEIHSADRVLSFLNWVDPTHYGGKDLNYGGVFSYIVIEITSYMVPVSCSALTRHLT